MGGWLCKARAIWPAARKVEKSPGRAAFFDRANRIALPQQYPAILVRKVWQGLMDHNRMEPNVRILHRSSDTARRYARNPLALIQQVRPKSSVDVGKAQAPTSGPAQIRGLGDCATSDRSADFGSPVNRASMPPPMR